MKNHKFIEKSYKIDKYPSVSSIYDESYNPNGDFYSFKNGSKIQHEVVQRWVKDSINFLLKNPEEVYYRISSGNTLVIVLRNDLGIDVIVSDSYMESNINKEDIY